MGGCETCAEKMVTVIARMDKPLAAGQRTLQNALIRAGKGDLAECIGIALTQNG